ncbi:MAG: Ig-like domain-containing protein, partial [Nodosilinea sp.]
VARLAADSTNSAPQSANLESIAITAGPVSLATQAAQSNLLNGQFSITDPTDPQFGWQTRGAASIINGAATLTESGTLNSSFSQAFTIPAGAKILQFTITGANLNPSTLAPADAFEVALLNATTQTPLLGTATGLSQTDALFNLQHDGKVYFAPQVNVPGISTSGAALPTNAPLTVRIDLSSVAPGTAATLYLDLLGFGQRNSTVTVDDVLLFLDGDNLPPIAQPDQATTSQSTPITLDVLANDTDPDGTLDSTSLAVTAQPTSGTVALNPDGTVTYTPNTGFTGSDSFTYTVKDNAGAISNPATVNITVNPVNPGNLPPVANPDTANTLEATPVIIPLLTNDTDADGSLNPATLEITTQPANGTVTPNPDGTLTYTPNPNFVGPDTFSYTVRDNQGTLSNPATVTVNVANQLPTITSTPGKTSLLEGETTTFSATATDPGDTTLTYTWNFGDGTDPVINQTVNHAYADNGTYTATLTVTDAEGESRQQTFTIQVSNVNPTITSLTGNTRIKLGDLSTFSATATDPGKDTLTYTWNFGDGSAPATGQSVSHTYRQNGTYIATLTVTDDDGGFTSQTLPVEVTREVNPITPYSGDYFVVPGSPDEVVHLRFQWTFRDAAYNNEIGVFVTDAQGRVNGIAPGESGYAYAALTSPTRQVLFASGQQAGAWQELTFRGGDRLAFYLIQNNTTANLLAQNPDNSPNHGPIAFFSVDGVNPDQFDHVNSRNLGQGIWEFSWEDLLGGGDRDFNDVKFVVSRVGIPIPGQPNQTATLKVDWVSQQANYKNEMGFFLVDNEAGHIGNLRPGDAGYAAAALSPDRSQVIFSQGQSSPTSYEYSVPAGQFLGWYLIQNATTGEFLSRNPANQLGQGPLAWFSHPRANPDGLSHIHYQTGNEMVWEDDTYVGDLDYNDLIFRYELKAPASPALVSNQSPIQVQSAQADSPIALASDLTNSLSVTGYSPDEPPSGKNLISAGLAADSEPVIWLSEDSKNSFAITPLWPEDEAEEPINNAEQSSDSPVTQEAEEIEAAGLDQFVTDNPEEEDMPS